MGYTLLMDLLNFAMDMTSIELAKLTKLTLECAGFPNVYFHEEWLGGGNPCVGCKVPKDQVEKLREVLTKTFEFFGDSEEFEITVEDNHIYVE